MPFAHLDNVFPGGFAIIHPELKGDSANCKFAFAESQGKTYFIKVQINPMSDDVNVDSIVGDCLNQIMQQHNSTQPINTKVSDCMPKYIDCCRVYVTRSLTGDKVFSNIPTQSPDHIIFACKANIQEALPSPKAVSNLTITDNNAYLNSYLKALGKLCSQLHTLGHIAGFVHNDAHLGNLQSTESDNKITKFYIIDLGRVGLFSTLKESLNTSANTVTEKTMTLDGEHKTSYVSDLVDQILNSPYYIPASKCSFVFDISTIMLGILRKFHDDSRSVVLSKFLEKLNEKLGTAVLDFNFTDDVNIIVNGRNVPVKRINMSSLERLIEISNVMSPMKPDGSEAEFNLSFHPSCRYLVAGLIALACVALSNDAAKVNGKLMTVLVDKLVAKQIMWTYYQYITPLNLEFIKQVGALCRRVLAPQFKQYQGDVIANRIKKIKGQAGGQKVNKQNTKRGGFVKPRKPFFPGYQTTDKPKTDKKGNYLMNAEVPPQAIPEEMEAPIVTSTLSIYDQMYFQALVEGHMSPPRPLLKTKAQAQVVRAQAALQDSEDLNLGLGLPEDKSDFFQ